MGAGRFVVTGLAGSDPAEKFERGNPSIQSFRPLSLECEPTKGVIERTVSARAIARRKLLTLLYFTLLFWRIDERFCVFDSDRSGVGKTAPFVIKLRSLS